MIHDKGVLTQERKMSHMEIETIPYILHNETYDRIIAIQCKGGLNWIHENEC